MSAIAGIDQALWDIKGKVLNAPVWQLMGGLVRDKIKAYSWVGGDRPAEVIDGITQLRNIGFDTFKLNGCEEMGIIDNSRAVDRAVNTVAQIREAFGNEIEFGLDFHGRVSAPMAKVLIKELEPYRPLFIEEPVLAEQAEYYPKLAEQTHIPIAAGERMFSRFEFKRVLEAGGIAILQPDLSRGRHHRMLQNCRDGRSLRCGAGAALPAWPDRAGCLSARRLCLPQCGVPGTEHGDSL
jgi:galactonate dehydratase